MRIVIPTTGSQGDVQPYVALGTGLQAAGHRVRIATHADFAAFVRGRGLDFQAIEEGSRALHETDAGRRMLAAGRNPLQFMHQFARLREPLLATLMAGILEACRDADLVLVTSTALLPGYAVAEKLALPTVALSCQPTTPNWSMASSLMPEVPAWLPGSRLYNRLSHLFVGEFFWQVLGGAVNQARRDVLGLPPLPFLGPPLSLFEDVHVLHGYSPLVVPRPPELGPHHAVTGYWFLDRPSGWRPPAGLVDFLAAGPPPVSVGFGSMQAGHAAEITDLMTRALARCGQRGVLLCGWGGLAPAARSDRVFAIEAVPHDWLFPRMAAVVHHGGAGTTAAGLRAGVPAIVVPFMADQPFWGRRLAQLGVAPRPIPRHQLTVENVAHAIHTAVTDRKIRARAAALGERIRNEDGVQQAVEAFHRFVDAPRTFPHAQPAAAPGRRRTPALRSVLTFLPVGGEKS